MIHIFIPAKASPNEAWVIPLTPCPSNVGGHKAFTEYTYFISWEAYASQWRWLIISDLKIWATNTEFLIYFPGEIFCLILNLLNSWFHSNFPPQTIQWFSKIREQKSQEGKKWEVGEILRHKLYFSHLLEHSLSDKVKGRGSSRNKLKQIETIMSTVKIWHIYLSTYLSIHIYSYI